MDGGRQKVRVVREEGGLVDGGSTDGWYNHPLSPSLRSPAPGSVILCFHKSSFHSLFAVRRGKRLSETPLTSLQRKLSLSTVVPMVTGPSTVNTKRKSNEETDRGDNMLHMI